MKTSTVLLLAALVAAAAALAPVDREIKAALEKDASINVIVYLPEFARPTENIHQGMTRAERRVAVHEARAKHAAPFQAPLLKLAKSAGFEVKAFWINNAILVKNATPALIHTFRTQRSVLRLEAADKIVARINEPMVHEVEEESTRVGRNMLEWGIEIINAPAAWEITTGEGITLSNIDTGVRYTHEAVADSYRGLLEDGTYDHDYNWLDPQTVPQNAPFDNNGHGTHTMGTIIGSESTGIGVAHGSKWIAAKGCASSSCSNAHLMESAEYVLCPTRQDGSDVNCTLGADVVSNSWGGGRGSTTYLTYIEAWRDAGSIPVFSQGNSGSSCATANSPGDLGIVIGVGSTTSAETLSSFSSRGPGVGSANFPDQKPDISAPGSAVRSSYYTSDTAYASLSGTSMAAPHVSGLVGLLLSANPSLEYDDIYSILTRSAVQTLGKPDGVVSACDGVGYEVYPNYFYGYGRIDALEAVNLALRY